MGTPTRIRDYNIQSSFEGTVAHRLGTIKRKFDFEPPEPEPVMLVGIDPGDPEAEPAVFVREGDTLTRVGSVPQQQITSGPLKETAADVPGVQTFIPEPLDAAAPEPVPAPVPVPSAIVFGEDFPGGMSAGDLLVFARDLADSPVPVKTKIKTWTNEHDQIIRIAAVSA